MTQQPLYSFKECMELMADSRIEELVALSDLMIEQWNSYTMEEQMALLTAMTMRRKTLLVNLDRKFLFLKNRNIDPP